MGNVNAAASSKAAPPGVSVPPAPPSGATGSEPPMTGLSESSAKLLEILQSNPGSYDTLHNHSRSKIVAEITDFYLFLVDCLIIRIEVVLLY